MNDNSTCGVFGIHGHSEAANLAYLGIYAMQHRGQESAGIAASDGHRCGWPRRWARCRRLQPVGAVEGAQGAGHQPCAARRRASRLANAQPFLIDCAHGQIAIAHNGNLVNAGELRDEFVRDGSIFQTSSDTEVVLPSLRRARASSRPSSNRSRRCAARFLRDAHAGPPDGRIRDPHGFRPLALGQLGDAWVVCSETCALDLIGATCVRDVEPGEVLVIGPDGVPHPALSAVEARALRVRARVFARPDSYVFGQSVNEVRTNWTRSRARSPGRCRRRRADPGLRRVCAAVQLR